MKFESAQSIIDAKSEQVIGVRNNSETAASPATERVETKLMAHDVVYQKLFTDLDGEHGDTICTSERIKLTPRVHDKDIVFFSGFTNRGGRAVEEVAEMAHQTSSRIHSLDKLPGIGTGDVLFEHEEKYRAYQEQLSKAITVAEFAKFDGLEKMDVVAHSQGAIEALIMADTNPELVDNIVLVNPAGIIPMTEAQLSKQGIKEFLPNMLDKGVMGLKDKAVDMWKNKDMLATSRAGIAEFSQHEDLMAIVQRVREQGTKVAIVMVDGDKLFGFEEMRKITTKDGNISLFESFDEYEIIGGNHGDILSKDRIHHVSKLIHKMRSTEPVDEYKQAA